TISVNSITQADPTVIVPASKRYGGDAILAANLQQSATGQWTGHWVLISASNQEQQGVWDNSAADLQTLITAGINKIANSLAQRYAVVGTATAADSNIELTIVNIQNLGNYADVTNYL